jgi:hypothetical protein
LSVEKSQIANLLYKDSGSSGYNIILSDYNENINNFTKGKGKKEPKGKVKKEVVVKGTKKSDNSKVKNNDESSKTKVYTKSDAQNLIDTFTKTLRFLGGKEKYFIEQKISVLQKTIKFLNK